MGRICPQKLGKYPPDPWPGGGTPQPETKAEAPRGPPEIDF